MAAFLVLMIICVALSRETAHIDLGASVANGKLANAAA
jgi:hypothetical protein